MTTHKKYHLQATGSVAVPAVSCDVFALDDAEAIQNAKRMSKDMVSANYYRFTIWAKTDEPFIAAWRVELVPTIIEQQG